MGGNPSAGENRREKQVGDVLPGPRKSLCCSNPASFTRPAEIVAAWSVEDGVSRAGSGEDGGGGCGEGGVVGLDPK